MSSRPRPLVSALAATALLATTALAQHDHHDSTRGSADRSALILPGQDAFGAIAEVVKLLSADPTTDWSKVDIERLREHLIDMSAVALRLRVATEPLAAGARFTLTGDAPAVTAARRMFGAHTRQLGQASRFHAELRDAGAGLVVSITARDPADRETAARARALGPVGYLALEEHHREHHLALARGIEH